MGSRLRSRIGLVFLRGGVRGGCLLWGVFDFGDRSWDRGWSFSF